jgi:hypothetical protein
MCTPCMSARGAPDGRHARILQVDDDRRLRDVLTALATRFAALEAASALPAETAALLGELSVAATAFLGAVASPTAVLDAAVPTPPTGP